MNSEFIDPEFQLNLSGGSDPMFSFDNGKSSEKDVSEETSTPIFTDYEIKREDSGVSTFSSTAGQSSASPFAINGSDSSLNHLIREQLTSNYRAAPSAHPTSHTFLTQVVAVEEEDSYYTHSYNASEMQTLESVTDNDSALQEDRKDQIHYHADYMAHREQSSLISYSRSSDFYLSSENNEKNEEDNSNQTLDTLEEVTRDYREDYQQSTITVQYQYGNSFDQNKEKSSSITTTTTTNLATKGLLPPPSIGFYSSTQPIPAPSTNITVATPHYLSQRYPIYDIKTEPDQNRLVENMDTFDTPKDIKDSTASKEENQVESPLDEISPIYHESSSNTTALNISSEEVRESQETTEEGFFQQPLVEPEETIEMFDYAQQNSKNTDEFNYQYDSHQYSHPSEESNDNQYTSNQTENYHYDYDSQWAQRQPSTSYHSSSVQTQNDLQYQASYDYQSNNYQNEYSQYETKEVSHYEQTQPSQQRQQYPPQHNNNQTEQQYQYFPEEEKKSSQSQSNYDYNYNTSDWNYDNNSNYNYNTKNYHNTNNYQSDSYGNYNRTAPTSYETQDYHYSTEPAQQSYNTYDTQPHSSYNSNDSYDYQYQQNQPQQYYAQEQHYSADSYEGYQRQPNVESNYYENYNHHNNSNNNNNYDQYNQYQKPDHRYDQYHSTASADYYYTADNQASYNTATQPETNQWNYDQYDQTSYNQSQYEYDQSTHYDQYPSSTAHDYPSSTFSEEYVDPNRQLPSGIASSSFPIHTQPSHHVNPVNPDISSDSDSDLVNQKANTSRNQPQRTTLSDTNTNNTTTNTRTNNAEPPPLPSTVRKNNSYNPPPTETNTKVRHLQIWERFFENAVKLSDNEGISSDNSVNRPSSLLKLGLMRLSSKDPNDERNHPFHSQSSETSTTNRNDNITAASSSFTSLPVVDFTSTIAKQYFTFAIAAELTWPVLISSKKYQSLIALAKATLGTPTAATSPIPHLAFMAAVMTADIENVNAFLMRGVNPNCLDQYHRTPIHHVARIGNESILALLFDSNAELDLVDDHQMSPLHIAVIFNRLAIVRFLLDSAVDITKRTAAGQTALEIAKLRHHKECEQLLVDFLQYSKIYSVDQLVSNPPPPSTSTVTKEKKQKSESDNQKKPHLTSTTNNTSNMNSIVKNTTSLTQRVMIPEINPSYLQRMESSEAGLDPTYSSLSSSHEVKESETTRGLLPIENKIAKRSFKKSSKSVSSNPLIPLSSQSSDRKVSFDLNKLKQKEKEVLERRKELEKNLQKYTNNSTTNTAASFQDPDNSDDDYLPNEGVQQSNNTLKPSHQLSIQVPSHTPPTEDFGTIVTPLKESNKSTRVISQVEQEEQDDNEEGEENEDESVPANNNSNTIGFLLTAMDRFSATIWSFAIAMIGLTLSLLLNQSSASAKSSNGTSYKKMRKQPSEEEQEEETLQLLGIGSPSPSTPMAPPTDEELKRKGILARASTISPTGAQVVAPQDVQLAIALSRAGKTLGSPVANAKQMREDVQNEIANRYSLGNQLPQGASWRYVNVMNVNNEKKNQ